MNGADFGLVGLAVMGQNLALNVERRGFSVAVYNRTAQRTDEFMERCGKGRNLVPAYSLEELVGALSRPRAIMLMVKAGAPVDAVLKLLFPLLQEGDILIDGGNSHFPDTDRRHAKAERRGLLYLGVGVSGGEYGALHGPSIMVGGHRKAYEQVEPILTQIAAKTEDGPCCAYLGPRSAGHYVKMVHNGIEYGFMQILAEAYDLMKRLLGMPPAEMSEVFADWNRKELASYLVEITEKILRHPDEERGEPLVEQILDTAKQKGTGKWASQSALDLGIPVPTITAAVYARMLSALKAERTSAAQILPEVSPGAVCDREPFLSDLFGAAYLSIAATYAQGFRLLQGASDEYGYELDLAEVARIWKGGCIVRAKMLDPIRQAFLNNHDLPMLILARPFRKAYAEHREALKRVLQAGRKAGIPVPAMAASLDFLDSYRSKRLPANLIQAQRDYFGAHTYQRIDREGVFHTDWEEG